MDRQAASKASPVLVAAVGAVLFVAAASHHVTEVRTLDSLQGPLVAFSIDGLPALAVVYGGYHLAKQSFRPEHSLRVLVATLAGLCIVGGMTFLSIVVRLSEGRPVGEPTFELLLAATTGALAGYIAGYYSARSMENARKATQAMSTLSFTNDVLRHDIKNDMTVIRGHANVIADAEVGHDQVAESARTIDDQVEEVLGVIESTGAISETLSENPDYEPVDLAAVARDVVAHSDEAFAATVTVEAPETVQITANDAVRQVVSNLVENGIEHNDADEPSVHVTVEPRAETVRLRVLDNGPGVPEGERRGIFAPRESDTGKGGLHVVSTLVENFGGQINVEDNEPRGAVFVVDFPRTESPNPFL